MYLYCTPFLPGTKQVLDQERARKYYDLALESIEKYSEESEKDEKKQKVVDAIQNIPKSIARTYWLKARQYKNKKQYKEAEKLLINAIELTQGNNSFYLYCLANIYSRSFYDIGKSIKYSLLSMKAAKKGDYSSKIMSIKNIIFSPILPLLLPISDGIDKIKEWMSHKK